MVEEPLAYGRIPALGSASRVGLGLAERAGENLQGFEEVYLVIEGEGAGRAAKIIRDIAKLPSEDESFVIYGNDGVEELSLGGPRTDGPVSADEDDEDSDEDDEDSDEDDEDSDEDDEDSDEDDEDSDEDDEDSDEDDEIDPDDAKPEKIDDSDLTLGTRCKGGERQGVQATGAAVTNLRSCSLSNDIVAAEAADECLLAGGSAVAAVLCGFFAAAGAYSGVLLGPLSLLVAGVGSGARAFDGRLRQPGLGTKRPRGFRDEESHPRRSIRGRSRGDCRSCCRIGL
ncbi:MAG: hypothetical protein QM784_15310 [Polyangiaceae bacterium]